MSDIAIRKVVFDFLPDAELDFVKGGPDLPYTFVGTWFSLPYIAPCLPRSMKQVIPPVKDERQRVMATSNGRPS